MANRRRHKQQVKNRALTAALDTAIRLSTVKALVAGEFEVDIEKGVLSNVSIITRGPAIGHGFDVDDVMLKQVAEAINGHTKGVKCRLTHPKNSGGMFGGGTDPIEVMLGRAKNARVDDYQVRGDIQFGNYAADGPNGDLRKYLMGIAQEDPEVIGLSIVFIPDDYEPRTDENDQSLPPAGRVKDVLAVDFVGDPGANPGGLLSSNSSDEGPSLTFLKECIMNKKLRTYLESVGLAADASLETAILFWKGLSGDQKAAADALSDGESKGAGKNTDTAHSGTVVADEVGTVGEEIMAGEAAAKALVADRTRREGIMALAQLNALDTAWAQGLCDRGVTLAHATELVELAKTHQPLPVGAGPRIGVGEDLNRSTLADGITDAIILRSGARMIELDKDTGIAVRDTAGKTVVRQPHERALQFRKLSLLDMGRHYLAALGVPGVDYMGRVQIAELLLNPHKLQGQYGIVALAQGTSDFPYILANALNKNLRAAYAEAPTQWPMFCSRLLVPDYKQFSLVSLSEAPDLVERDEGGPVEYGTLTENREVATLAEFAKGIRITRRTMVNDDLNAFSRLPQMLGPAAKRKEDDVAFAILTANAALGQDSIALFDAATHKNYITAGAVPSVATLNVGAAAMGVQKGIGGASYLDIQPKSILCPIALSGTVKQLIASVVDPSKNNAAENIWRNRLEVVANARLDAANANGWYLAADPSLVDTIVVAFLEEEQTPVTQSETDFDTGDLKISVRHSVVAKAIDYRGLFYNDGVT